MQTGAPQYNRRQAAGAAGRGARSAPPSRGYENVAGTAPRAASQSQRRGTGVPPASRAQLEKTADMRRISQEQYRAEETETKIAKQAKTRGKLGRIDIPLLTIVLMLLLFGLVMLFSASYPTGHLRYDDSFAFIRTQVRYAVVGLGCMVAAALFDYRLLKKFAWPLMFVALALMVVVLFVPAKNDAHRWIWLNSAQTQSFQPSELAKLAVILLFAALISANQNKIKTLQYGFLPFVVILGVVAGLLIAEPHLSCTILVLGIGISMMFAGGTAVRWFGFAGIVAVAALYFTLTQFPDLVPYAADRVRVWMDPFAAGDDGHQTVQSLIAVGSGGVSGLGIGHSVQKFLYLPEMYNDYIFAIVCEELGMIGAVAVMLLFLALLVRGMYIAVKARDKFGSMLVIGVSVQIALQAMLHIAVNINAIPSTGISLPFFSSGGSSLVMLLGEIGIILSVSRKANLAASVQQPQDAQEEQEASGTNEAAGVAAMEA